VEKEVKTISLPDKTGVVISSYQEKFFRNDGCLMIINKSGIGYSELEV